LSVFFWLEEVSFDITPTPPATTLAFDGTSFARLTNLTSLKIRHWPAVTIPYSRLNFSVDTLPSISTLKSLVLTTYSPEVTFLPYSIYNVIHRFELTTFSLRLPALLGHSDTDYYLLSLVSFSWNHIGYSEDPDHLLERWPFGCGFWQRCWASCDEGYASECAHGEQSIMYAETDILKNRWPFPLAIINFSFVSQTFGSQKLAFFDPGNMFARDRPDQSPRFGYANNFVFIAPKLNLSIPWRYKSTKTLNEAFERFVWNFRSLETFTFVTADSKDILPVWSNYFLPHSYCSPQASNPALTYLCRLCPDSDSSPECDCWKDQWVYDASVSPHCIPCPPPCSDQSYWGYDPLFESLNCSRYSLRACSKCKSCAPFNHDRPNYNQFQVAPCANTSDTQCEPCNLCESADTYILSNCTPTSQSICGTCDVCQKNEYRAMRCTKETPKRCKECSVCIPGTQRPIRPCDPGTNNYNILHFFQILPFFISVLFCVKSCPNAHI
jgi:hypothetical protein